ncbi:MAG: hypothetical protein ACWGPR_10840 [Candidatus Deferrimicrobiaceae bacterium]
MSTTEAEILTKLVLPGCGEVGELDDDGVRAVCNLIEMDFVSARFDGGLVSMWPTRKGKYRILNPGRLKGWR